MKRAHAPQSHGEAGDLRDPVCGMQVTQDSPHHATHAGRDYWFCSAPARTRFVEAPAQ